MICDECGKYEHRFGRCKLGLAPEDEACGYLSSPQDSKASSTQVSGSHYKDFEIQPSEFIHRNKLGWCEGNVIKYVCRHKNKNGRVDIEKAIHYLQLLLEWEYPEEK